VNEIWRVAYDDAEREHTCVHLSGGATWEIVVRHEAKGARDQADERDVLLGKVVAEANRRCLRLTTVLSDEAGLLMFFVKV
jgi:hypothetical protein